MGGLEEMLERGEVVDFPTAPFPLPVGDDYAFLLTQRLRRTRKSYNYNPHTEALSPHPASGPVQAQRLAAILAAFSRSVLSWVVEALPGYAGGCEPDRVSFCPEEEATRRLRFNARNDLLHVDAFPNRPARGRRILRVFANLSPDEPRVWATSDPLPALVPRYRGQVEGTLALRELGGRALELFRKPGERRAPSDWFMLRLHDFLKRNHRFQTEGNRRLRRFPPGAVWLAMTDACSHAVLRGRYALEHSFFIRPAVLALPDLSPEGLLRAA